MTRRKHLLCVWRFSPAQSSCASAWSVLAHVDWVNLQHLLFDGSILVVYPVGFPTIGSCFDQVAKFHEGTLGLASRFLGAFMVNVVYQKDLQLEPRSTSHAQDLLLPQHSGFWAMFSWIGFDLPQQRRRN